MWQGAQFTCGCPILDREGRPAPDDGPALPRHEDNPQPPPGHLLPRLFAGGDDLLPVILSKANVLADPSIRDRVPPGSLVAPTDRNSEDFGRFLDPKTTLKHYTKVIPESLRSAVATLDAQITGVPVASK